MRDFASTDTFTGPFERAVQFLSEAAQDGGVYGLVASAPALLTAAAVRRGARTLLQVLPDGDAAASAASDVRFYLGATGSPDRVLEQEVLLYPSSDILPYSSEVPDTEVSLARSALLYRLVEADAPRVVMSGLDALLRKVTPRRDFGQSCFSLRRGEELDREFFLEQLVAAGYRRSPLVEEPGDFSVRGFIIDLYSPLYPFPVRVEQMGDSVESLRFFDPTNQRSRDDVPYVRISPLHMLIPDPDALERGLVRLHHVCEDRGVEKRVRQRLIDDFKHGVRFPGAESYLPYFFPELETLLDYLPSDATLVLPDQDTLLRAFEDVEEEIFRGWEAAAGDGQPVPSPESLFLTREEFFQRIALFRQVTVSSLEIEERGATAFRVPCHTNKDIRPELLRGASHDSAMGNLVKRLQQWRDDGCEIFLVSHTRGQAERLLKLLEPYPAKVDFRGEGFESSNLTTDPTPGLRLYVGELSSGFRMEEARRIVLTEEEIFGSRVRTSTRLRARGSLISSLTDLVENEPVVHEDYGIGIFRGLATREFDSIPSEVMVIEYSGGDLLYHPLERLHVIQKYISGSEEAPHIDRLGGKGWAKTKARVKKSIQEMAKDLLEIYAKRQISTRKAYAPPDENFAAFEASFEYEETPDQEKAIQDVMEAMDSDKPMDRLVCGDVGYGKTEVALRAAFRTILDGKQAAILVPTTVLAQQHYDTALRRFNGYPIRADVLSRFRTAAEQKIILKDLVAGKIDLIIGTHRLLQKDISFRDLGLLVVDEEQRFGVTHKERIKKYKAHVDVLTLTATPIPRTLHFSLTGLRDLSVIDTPPENRKSIRTHVMRQSDEVIRDAVLRELTRGGQVFYIHNRVRTIYKRAAALQRLVPEGAFGVAHGQMPERDLERVMLDFIRGKINVLVCTSIIESGLDIPRANTMIIERADTFGLADLYQLRGRVGRSDVRAYAYLLTPPETLMTQDAIKRLAVIQEHSGLGQGFRIAMRDLEIRGAGNILGSAQSGHVAQVGYEMYLELLEEAIQQMKGEEPPPRIDPEISLGIEARIPEEYVPDQQQRMSLYKRLSRASEDSEVDGIEDEIMDRFGRAPTEVANLLSLMRIRLAMKALRISKMDCNGPEFVLSFDAQTPVSPQLIIQWAQTTPETVRFLPGDRVAFRIRSSDSATRIKGAFELLDALNSRMNPREATGGSRE
jgi:transcription-repair coupling factor (superfamily II helicase)